MGRVKSKKVLYAGDGPPEGAARYLLAILKQSQARVLHVPPDTQLSSSVFDEAFDGILLSDMPRKRVSAAAQERIAAQVRRGAGLAMIGGWASFSGNHGGWAGSVVEDLLPVECAPTDDRLNAPGGLLLVAVDKHPILSGLSSTQPPVICGLNKVRTKPGARVLLNAQPLKIARVGKEPAVALHKRAYPLLVVGKAGAGRTAAFTCDFAPHWSGGLVDWGQKRVRVQLPGDEVEVGDRYIQFGLQLLQWLSSTERET